MRKISLRGLVAASLLMFIAATCVALVVKSRARPQPSAALSMPNGVIVCFLHGNTRCPTCLTIEAYAKEAVDTGFADALQRGTLAWRTINYEAPGNEHFVKDYDVIASSVVLLKFKDGAQVAWKGLPEVWGYTDDKPAFLDFVQTSLRDFVAEAEAGAPTPERAESTEPATGAEPLPLPE